MAKDKSANIINWIAGAGALFFIGSAIAGAIKRKREGVEGIGRISDYDILDYVVGAYDFLIELGEQITGEEFARRISRYYDVSDPRTRACVEAAERIPMLKKDWRGTHWKAPRDLSIEGIGAVKSKRRIWNEVQTAQKCGIDLSDPTGYEGNEKVLQQLADGKVKPSASGKPLEVRYFNQLRRAYKSIAGTELPYTESKVQNEYGDTILIYRDYHLDRLPIDAAQFVMDHAIDDLYAGNAERACYWYTIGGIAQGKLKFCWNDKGVHRGAGTLIFGDSAPEERKLRISYIATPEKGGIWPEQLAHQLWEGDLTQRSDTQSNLDGILDAIRTCTSVGEARQICIDKYMEAHQVQEPDIMDDPGEDLPF